ncbi:hypothetical protein JOF41_003338 [Saccharothrix coeruleofusca]|uniref:hypothetical protein n=1 Tax=Saccharothrix coeruleofusca TaxID=33919 RepID=UPI001AE4EB4D|nr:hypothetical protein [Saccharothrix coeruleofusca]MBP2337160.1 hypothetical protein [Saccharothrix coeruleofusca]
MRKLLVWTHVVSSTTWMCMALALFAVVGYASAAVGEQRRHAFEIAHLLDVEVLQFAATTAAFTGLMLSGLTPWGYFRHWWVLLKFGITLIQLYVGIFVLSPNLHPDGSAALTRVGALLMASALACQVWLSVAKPGGRTPWASAGRLPTAPPWAFAACLAVPFADYALGEFLLGQSIPLMSLLLVVCYPVARRIAGSSRRRKAVAAR